MDRLKSLSKQLVKAAACFLLMLSILTPVNALSGECGNGVNWSLNNGVLTISGKGSMSNYTSESLPPWYDYRDSIVRIVVENGVTSIGDLAFLGCENVKGANIANSVTSIGMSAFMECTSLENIIMSNKVQEVDDYAFKSCTSLKAIILPNTLKSIGFEAFYGCHSLVSITIPSSVTEMEECIFRDCINLLQVYVSANIKTLPAQTFYECSSLLKVSFSSSVTNLGQDAFYGCDNLNKVTTESTGLTAGRLTVQIKEDIPNFGNVESVGSTNLETTYKPDNGGNTVQKDVVENDDVTISGNVEKNPTNDSLDITVDVVIKDEDGWDKVVDKIVDYEDKKGSYNDDTPIDVNVSIEGKQEISGDIINELAGKNVNLTINGDIEVEIPCHLLDEDKKYSGFSLEYTLEKIEEASSDVKEAIGEAQGYYLKFKDSMDYEVTVKIPISRDYARNYASIYKKEDGKWSLLQSVQLDNDGNASFYLIGFDSSKYLIGINVEGTSNVLIPEDLYDDYGGLTDEYGNKYVTTGVAKSSWGITYGQFTMILFAVLAVVVVIIGAVMFIMNKRQITLQKIRDEVMNDKNFKRKK